MVWCHMAQFASTFPILILILMKLFVLLCYVSGPGGKVGNEMEEEKLAAGKNASIIIN